MNVRSQVLLALLEHIAADCQSEPLRIIEVGTMFQQDEGLSTYVIADFLSSRSAGGSFVSIDADQEHIESSKMIMDTLNPCLRDQVEYRCGLSLTVLPEVVKELAPVHLFFLDGGAQPEVCLAEFEVAAANLALGGMVLVDDAQSILPSERYPWPRPFGKATLILPMLILGDYLGNRVEILGGKASLGNSMTIRESRLIKGLKDTSILHEPERDFAVYGSSHRMLVYGKSSTVARVMESVEPSTPRVSRFRNLLRAVKGLFVQ